MGNQKDDYSCKLASTWRYLLGLGDFEITFWWTNGIHGQKSQDSEPLRKSNGEPFS